ncbi:hypothetical protein PENTCL1PPCAC_1512 [Pristionchus entomophagus]|uniref:BTB domain-containing protein n=1 Tax=Pristionchus entomophagus TaxID=358040 RepID=A0AAV5SAF4_9BILA|nr:hypothetical protein PENTCL1PPCAC_1512 [Pristionchus entomophagus]
MPEKVEEFLDRLKPLIEGSEFQGVEFFDVPNESKILNMSFKFLETKPIPKVRFKTESVTFKDVLDFIENVKAENVTCIVRSFTEESTEFLKSMIVECHAIHQNKLSLIRDILSRNCDELIFDEAIRDRLS